MITWLGECRAEQTKRKLLDVKRVLGAGFWVLGGGRHGDTATRRRGGLGGWVSGPEEETLVAYQLESSTWVSKIRGAGG